MDAAWEASMSSVIALSIGGISAILGLWVGRDKRRPAYFALAMTFLVGAAVGVGVVQSVLDAEDALKKQADLDRMVETVSEIAMATGDTELVKLIEEQAGKKIELPPAEPEPAEPAEGDGPDAAPADAAPADAAPADAAPAGQE